VLGRPPVLDLAGQLTGNGAPSNDVLLRDQAYGLLWLIPAGLVAAGWGFGRDCRAAFERLGLVRPNRRQVLGGLGVAVACAGASLLLDGALAWFWGAMGWPRTDSKQLETLFAFATSPTGALVAGVTAGLGEELVMRGLLQPRLGLVLTNLCFTAMHAPQYNWDALLSVFVIGLVFGLVRRRTNTTTGALVHGTFDFLLFLAAALGISAI
jgi:membrane protease YdiL (CAAX protease family)